MLPFVVTLVLTSTVLLVWGLRGRVVARGEFCSRCRFNLVGLDLGDRTLKCPECGRSVCNPDRRIQTYRTWRPTLILAAATSMTLAGVLAYLHANPRDVYRHLPDQVVANCALGGTPVAIAEAIDRISDPSRPSDAFDELIHRSVESYVTSTDSSWVDAAVVNACVTANRLTLEQHARIDASLRLVSFDARHRIHTGTRELPFTIDVRDVRPFAIINAIVEEISLHLEFTQDGLASPIPLNDPKFDQIISEVLGSSGKRGAYTGSVVIPPEISTQHPSSHFEVHCVIEIRLAIGTMPAEATTITHRATFNVDVAEPETSLVVYDPSPFAGKRMATIISLRSIERPVNASQSESYLLGSVVTEPGPHLRAWYEVSFVVNGIEEPVGYAFIRTSPVPDIPSDDLSFIVWDNPPPALDAINATLERWSEADRVDVIFRPDPNVEHARYLISSMPEASFVFRSVPIRAAGFRDQYPRIQAEIIQVNP